MSEVIKCSGGSVLDSLRRVLHDAKFSGNPFKEIRLSEDDYMRLRYEDIHGFVSGDPPHGLRLFGLPLVVDRGRQAS
ncbi:hypothetical protein IMZ29_00840 [Achromobacter sp. GG226]|uniref:hypothetical protein n=1 Tax=Verticiella alkaliphila TaxID=2779529 RepID=UPI001C0BAA6B|nr:hypothetical protein [Verticiella sp. GG226]MBU4609149.1 hypothetical protein [Verticiella sp. GG226]